MFRAALRVGRSGGSRHAKVPVLFIAAHTVAPDIVRFRELCPQLVTGQTVGAGHFNQLLVPDQVNSMIERFLAIIPGGSLAMH